MTETPGDPTSPAAGPLAPLAGDHAIIARILDRLGVTTDLPERADLASELVRAASRHEYVVENAVLPALDGRLDGPLSDSLAVQRDEVRQTMDYIHKRTRHLAARNAHADDPQGLEDAIAEASTRLRTLLTAEDAALPALVGTLAPPDTEALAKAVAKASRHAAERPKPARTTLGRLASNAATKVDHLLEDVATPDHEGAETIEG
jgi:hypothetical protein